MANPKPKTENLTQKGLGRKKGSKNKFTSLKDDFLASFKGIGGREELTRWAKQQKNRATFYQMIAKMLPNKLESEIEHTNALNVNIVKYVSEK